MRWNDFANIDIWVYKRMLTYEYVCIGMLIVVFVYVDIYVCMYVYVCSCTCSSSSVSNISSSNIIRSSITFI